MSKENFSTALSRTLVHEGGKVNHPSDPGGRTNQGVTQKVYTSWRSLQKLPPQDVFLMDAAERDAIYRTQYWAAIRGDLLPTGLDFALFDGAVMSGSVQAVKWLQRALGVTADGQVGQVTLDAIANYPDVDRLIGLVCERRLLFCRALRTWPVFGKGWKSRISNVQAFAQAQAVGSVGPQPIYALGMERKALLSDAKKAPQTIAADAGAGGGVSVTGLTAWFQEKTAAFAGVSDTLDEWLGYLMAVAAVVALLCGAYAWYARKRAAVLADRLDTKPVQLVASPAVTESTDA